MTVPILQYKMTDPILQSLQETNVPQEKAAILAEAIFALLPEEVAFVARRCAILHWFDQSLVEALLEDRELTLDEMSNVYGQLLTLPFIDTIPGGLTYQNLTREGLIKRYSITQPELLQTAARLAAPYFEMREEDKKSVMEAFFCYIVAGEYEASRELQDTLFEDASSNQDWQRLDSLIQIQEEAERLPFVQPVPRNEQQFLLQGLIHRIQGKREDAILDYKHALTLNPRSILAYVSRGTVYAEQDHFAEALADYNKALQFDENFAQVYQSRGNVYTKQGKYKEAFEDNAKAIQLGLCDDIVFISKGNILNKLGKYEDAVAAYDAALRINTASVNAYIGKGEALNRLERHAEALSAYNDAIHLDPNSSEAYRGKWQALNRLASVAYKQAKFRDTQITQRHLYPWKLLATLAIASVISILLISGAYVFQSSFGRASGPLAFMGFAIYLLVITTITALDWHGFLTLNGSLKWKSMAGWQKLVVGCLFVVLNVFVLGFYLAQAYLTYRRYRQLEPLRRRRKIAELEAELGMIPRTEGKCHKCHQPLQVGAEFCAYCGEPVTQRPRICPECYTATLPDARWCPACGAQLDTPVGVYEKVVESQATRQERGF